MHLDNCPQLQVLFGKVVEYLEVEPCWRKKVKAMGWATGWGWGLYKLARLSVHFLPFDCVCSTTWLPGHAQGFPAGFPAMIHDGM